MKMLRYIICFVLMFLLSIIGIRHIVSGNIKEGNLKDFLSRNEPFFIMSKKYIPSNFNDVDHDNIKYYYKSASNFFPYERAEYLLVELMLDETSFDEALSNLKECTKKWKVQHSKKLWGEEVQSQNNNTFNLDDYHFECYEFYIKDVDENYAVAYGYNTQRHILIYLMMNEPQLSYIQADTLFSWWLKDLAYIQS